MRASQLSQVVAGLTLFACAGSSAPPDPSAGPAVSQSREPSPVMLTAEKPSTLHIEVKDDARRQIEERLQAQGKATVRLVLKDVSFADSKPGAGTIRVFVGDVEDGGKSIDQASYAGSVELPPLAGSKSGEKHSYAIDAAPAMRKLKKEGKLDLAKPLPVTLVLSPAEENGAQQLELKSAQMEIPKPKSARRD